MDATLEATNGLIQAAKRRARGYRSSRYLITMVYMLAGKLELDLPPLRVVFAHTKHPKVKAWLSRHKRFHVHFIPTSSSWSDIIERFFRDLDEKRVRRGGFQSVPQLIDAIMGHIDQHNSDPKPFAWKKTAEEITDRVGRARLVPDSAPTG